MDSNLSKEQEMLLFKACKDNDGVLSIHLARQMYSSNNTAKSAINKLELFDFIEQSSPGYWKVVKLPNDIKRELDQVLGDEKESEPEASETSRESSEFKIKA